MEQSVEKFGLFRYGADGMSMRLPFDLEEYIYVIADCDDISLFKNKEGVRVCPFEHLCGKVECSNTDIGTGDLTLNIYETGIDKILIDEKGLHIFVENISKEFTVDDIGKTIFNNLDDAEKEYDRRKAKEQ